MNRLPKCCIAFLLLWSCNVFSQSVSNWPAKPIKIIVPMPAGGYFDVIARTVGQKMSERLGQPVLVDNRGGANGIIGTDLAAKAPPDGYTILLGGNGVLTINPVLYPKLPYDTQRDFAPIILVSSGPNVLVVHSAVNARSVQDFIALARARPGDLSYGSAGSGSTQHLGAAMFAVAFGVRMNHIPYKGSAPAVTAIVAGQTDSFFGGVSDVYPFIRSGKLRALAVTSTKRVASLPEVPTMIESGARDYEIVAWFALVAPAGTPSNIITKLNADVNRTLAMSDVRETLSIQGTREVLGGTPEQLGDLIKLDFAKWPKVIKNIGVTID